MEILRLERKESIVCSLQSGFQLSVENNSPLLWLCFTILSGSLRKFMSLSEPKAKPIVACSHAFSALGALSRVLIG